MQRITEYKLEIPGPVILRMPKGAHIFALRITNGMLLCSVLVDSEAPLENRAFRFVQSDVDIEGLIGQPIATVTFDQQDVEALHLIECEMTPDLVRTFVQKN